MLDCIWWSPPCHKSINCQVLQPLYKSLSFGIWLSATTWMLILRLDGRRCLRLPGILQQLTSPSLLWILLSIITPLVQNYHGEHEICHNVIRLRSLHGHAIIMPILKITVYALLFKVAKVAMYALLCNVCHQRKGIMILVKTCRENLEYAV